MQSMLNQVNDLIEHIHDDPKFIPGLARLLKRMYDELIAVGFTDDQASRIVANYKAVGQ